MKNRIKNNLLTLAVLFFTIVVFSNKGVAQACSDPLETPFQSSDYCTVGYTAVTMRDNGGTGNYSNNSSDTFTVCPATAGDKVSITFTLTSFRANDSVIVYNGSTVSTASRLAYATATTTLISPDTYTSTASDGCITVVLRSDPSNTRAGFTALLVSIPAVKAVYENGIIYTNGGTAITNVTSNDSIAGSPATLGATGNATIATSGTWPTGFTLSTTSGAITVASGTAPGTYPVAYTLCRTATPVICKTVTDTIRVIANARPKSENGTIYNNGGTAITNVVSNDSIGGGLATLGATGNATIATSGTWPTGITLNTTSGAITVASGTALGTYPVTYTLCDKTTPTTNCASVTDTIYVRALVRPRTESGYVPNAGGVVFANITSNDSIGNEKATLGASGNATIAMSGTWPTGFSLNTTTGAVTIASGLTPGVYTIAYNLCSTASPTLCQIAVDTVTVYPFVNSSCASLTKFCAQDGITLDYIVNVNAGTAASINPGNNYGCLLTTPRPSWYYIRMSNSDPLNLTLNGEDSLGGPRDVDFALWGPFSNLDAAEDSCGLYKTPIDCSYSTAATESINIPASAEGNVYVLLVTGYSPSIRFFNITADGDSDCRDVFGVCNIDSIGLSNFGNCNTAGTASTTDDYFTADVYVNFHYRPLSGTLSLSGTAINSGTYSVPVSSITTDSSYVFTGVQLKAYAGGALTATFSSNTSCTYTLANINVTPNGTLSPPVTLCEGDPAQVTFTSTSGTGPFSLIINGNTYSSITSGTAFSVTPYPATTTTYNLTKITDAKGCVKN